MDLLTERRLRDVLALRRIREAALLRDRDKVPELMNLHRRSDTPLGPPVCLRLPIEWAQSGSLRIMEVDDVFEYDWVARASHVLVWRLAKTNTCDLIFDSGFSR